VQTQNNLFNFLTVGYSVEIPPTEFPELESMTGAEVNQYLKEKYGKDGYNKNTDMYCMGRNIVYDRVCYEFGDNDIIISTPHAG
jgi:hypothetical protein